MGAIIYKNNHTICKYPRKYMHCFVSKAVFGVSSRLDTNWVILLQKIARGL